MSRVLYLIVAVVALLSNFGSSRAQPHAAEPGSESATAEGGDSVREGQPETVLVRPGGHAEGPGALVGESTEHRGALRALTEPTQVTVIDTADHDGERRTVSEVLATTVGVHASGLGGLGAFSSVSVRGAAPGHTTVVVDGVPLSKLASVTHDLSAFELGSFDRLELYRSGAPAGYGSAILGGALALSTAVGPHPAGKRLWMGVGGGSFGARHANVRYLDGRPDGSLGYQLAVGYAGAEGDFDFFDDGGTLLNPDDDTTSRRQNNDYDRADYSVRVESHSDSRTLSLGLRGSWKSQGVPGPANNQSRLTSLTSLNQLLILGADSSDVALGIAARATAYASVERQHYSDPLSEIGLQEQDRRYHTLTGGALVETARDLPANQRLLVTGDIHGDYFREADVGTSARQESAGRRLGLGIAVGDEILVGRSGRLLLRPTIRLDHLRTGSISDPYDPTMTSMTGARTDTIATPRLSALVRISEAISTKANAGRTFRAPTLLEVFGDRGFVVGNPEVEPEVGLAADVGVVVAPSRAHGFLDRIYAEVVVFASRLDDPIVLATQNGLVAQARNLEAADVRGVETTGSVRLSRQVTLSGNYSLLDTRQRTRSSGDGKRLPNRPRHQIYARADLARMWSQRLVNLWFDVQYASGNYLDEANVFELPRRLIAGTGVKAGLTEDLLVGVQIKNLGGTRIEYLALSPPPRPDLTNVPRPLADVHGYPLPGRAFYLSIEWSH